MRRLSRREAATVVGIAVLLILAIVGLLLLLT
jgi:hypothetical protein